MGHRVVALNGLLKYSRDASTWVRSFLVPEIAKTSRLLWAAIICSPLLWIAQLVLSSALTPALCRSRRTWVLLASRTGPGGSAMRVTSTAASSTVRIWTPNGRARPVANSAAPIGGLYAAVAYAVSQREAEIAVRVALGASPRGVMLLVLRDPLTTTLLGIAAGIPGSWLLMRWASTLLFGVSPFDAPTVAICAAAMVLFACAAAARPALRALEIDAAPALRSS